MMREFFQRSIRIKVMTVVLATTFMALLSAAGALVFYDALTYKKSWVNDLRTQADLLARVSAPALAFDDPKVAQENLALLRARPVILAGAIYAAGGKLVASYEQEGASGRFPPVPGPEGHAIHGDEITLVHRIMDNNEVVGTVYLRARYQLFSRLADYLIIMGGVMIGALLLAALISARLQAAVTTPILAVVEVAREVMNDRHFSLRVQKTTEDEIGLLVDAFNNMLAEVGHRADALEASNQSLHVEMAERKVAEEALRAADQRKDEFLATLAHELRNPLAPIRQAARIGGLPGVSEQQLKWSRDIIDRQIRHMALLLDDLLDVSRISRGRLELKKERALLAAVVDAAVETARPAIDAKEHALSFDLPAQPVELTVDPLRVSQILSNLLTNAAKYTDPGGRIHVAASVANQELTLRVRDNGIGLAPETLPRIFLMFSQVKSALDRAEGGLGIGLALAKGLVELHGGTIEAASEGLGKGAEFIVRLPCEARYVSAIASASAQDPAGSATCKMLFADDNRDAAQSLAMLFQLEGNEVRTAYDGEEAFRVAAEFRPDIAVLDIGMPKLNGHDLARRIRSSTWGRHTMLIALTGWGQTEDRNRAREAGFDIHFTKPIDPNNLRPWVAAAVERRTGKS